MVGSDMGYGCDLELHRPKKKNNNVLRRERERNSRGGTAERSQKVAKVNVPARICAKFICSTFCRQRHAHAGKSKK